MSDNFVYTVREVATVLKVSEKTVYNLIHSQELKCIRVRGQIRVTTEQLQEYLKGGGNSEKRNSW